MFEFFKKKSNNVKPVPALQSWHYSKSQGKMVPCASTPCKLHGNRDVMASDAYTATIEFNKRLQAYQDYKANQAGGMGMVKEPAIDPNNALPVDYKKVELFKNNSGAKNISLKTMRVGNARYVPCFKAWRSPKWGTDLTINFSKRCENCYGSGKVKNKEGKEIICPECSGRKYSPLLSASPADMVLIQDIRNAEDERFHGFVRSHPDEFNEYMRHVIMSRCYLANDGEKEVYAGEFDRDFRADMANDPNNALQHMNELKAKYDAAMEGKTADIDYNNVSTALLPYGEVKFRNVRIIDSHEYTDKKGVKKMVITAIDDRQASNYAYKLFVDYNPRLVPGHLTQIDGYIMGYDKKSIDDDGRPVVVLRNSKIAG